MQTTKNSINWFEIPVRDIATAATFYGEVLGRPLKQESFGGIPHAVLAATGDAAVTGALIEDSARTAHGGVTIYLDVEAVQPAVDRAVKAGAKLVQPFTDLGPFGTCARIEDRDGNVVGLHTEKQR
jgi:uncharacterized protein